MRTDLDCLAERHATSYSITEIWFCIHLAAIVHYTARMSGL